MTSQAKPRRFPKVPAALAVVAAFCVGVVLMMLWLMGAFSPKVAADLRADSGRRVGTGTLVQVSTRTLPLIETAVGTVQPVHRVEVASRLLARAMDVRVVAGQSVAKDEVLVTLESGDLEARLAQADAAVAQAQATLAQAKSEEARLREAFDKNAVAGLEMDRAVNARKAVEASLTRAEQAQAEARTVLSYATIRSPIDGTVIDKRVNAGDTVQPGQVVATLLDPKHMQLVASVRESLSSRLSVGGTVSVKLDVLDHACMGTVSEIVPEAESASRTFQVKVTGPCPEGVYSGMFGRLNIQVGEESVLLVPVAAVHTVGQIESVDVAANGLRERRALRLGRTFGDQVEVLSGLRPGESVVVDAPGMESKP